MVSPYGPRTFNGTGELQERPDKNPAKKLGVKKCDCCLNDSLYVLLLFTMKFDECRTYLLTACGPRNLVASWIYGK